MGFQLAIERIFNLNLDYALDSQRNSEIQEIQVFVKIF